MKINSVQVSDWPEGPWGRLEEHSANLSESIAGVYWPCIFSPKSATEVVSV